MALDLILRGGRVLDPSQRLDRMLDVGFAAGKVAALGERLEAGPASEVRDVTGLLVTPGLIDLHTHVYVGGTSLSVDPDAYARNGAVATLVDTGSAGPGNFAGFRDHVIARARARILAYLHVSHAGIYGFSRTVMVGESEDLRLMDPVAAARVADANRDSIVGIKVRVGRHASGQQGTHPLRIALQVAEETGLPLMAHIDEPPPTYEEVLALLRPGDVLTHAFRPFPNAPVTAQGALKPAVAEARARGVLLDIGHGMGSFSFRTARSMLANGQPPDCISSDVHALCIDGPAFDLCTTLSKLLCLGMSLADVIAAATRAPALTVRRPELGTLKPGALGDASLLALESGRFDYVDSTGEHLEGTQRLAPKGLVRAGALW